jgi:hypothetical protein
MEIEIKMKVTIKLDDEAIDKVDEMGSDDFTLWIWNDLIKEDIEHELGEMGKIEILESRFIR